MTTRKKKRDGGGSGGGGFIKKVSSLFNLDSVKIGQKISIIPIGYSLVNLCSIYACSTYSIVRDDSMVYL